MAKRKIYLGHLPTHKSFRPYALAIGQAAIAWNALHEAFRGLLGAFFLDHDITDINALWHSLRNDRAQRELIRAVAKNWHAGSDLSDVGYEGIRSLIDDADTVSIARNDAIHSPLISAGYRKPNAGHAAFHGHPRALRLEKRELLAEFRWCRDAAITLTGYCMALDVWLTDGQREPSPKKAQLPNRERKNTSQGQRSRP